MYCCRRQKGEQRVRTAAENRMKREWIGFLFLLLLSVRDIREKKVNRKGRCICGFAVCLLSALLSGFFYFCGRAFYGRYCRDISYFGAEREQKDGNTVSAVSYVFLSDLFG